MKVQLAKKKERRMLKARSGPHVLPRERLSFGRQSRHIVHSSRLLETRSGLQSPGSVLDSRTSGTAGTACTAAVFLRPEQGCIPPGGFGFRHSMRSSSSPNQGRAVSPWQVRSGVITVDNFITLHRHSVLLLFILSVYVARESVTGFRYLMHHIEITYRENILLRHAKPPADQSWQNGRFLDVQRKWFLSLSIPSST